MTYDRQILKILSSVGERGISVQAVAKHVYNLNTTFFSSPDLEEVHSYVQQFLLRNSRSPQSLVAHTGRRGYYCLNTKLSADARQMMLAFREEADGVEEEQPQPKQDLSLDLFDAADF